MSKLIKLYSNTGCFKCAMLKRWLDMKKITYEEINISNTPEARELLLSKGLRQLPQVQIENEFIKFSEYNDILNYL